MLALSRIAEKVIQRNLQEMKLVVVLFELWGSTYTENYTGNEACGCSFRATSINMYRELYKKRSLWLSFLSYESQHIQRNLQEMKFVVVLFELRGSTHTEKSTGKEVCGCPFRATRFNIYREIHSKWIMWLYFGTSKGQKRKGVTNKQDGAAVRQPRPASPVSICRRSSFPPPPTTTYARVRLWFPHRHSTPRLLPQPADTSVCELLCLPEETRRLEELSREGSPERRP